jgi:hypothetical protein
MSVQGAHTRGPLRLGADLPVYLRSLGSEGAETGLGDFALDAKLTALSADDKPLGLALSGRLSLPTATVQAPLGTEGVGWTLGVIGDTTLGERVHAAVNLGVRLVPLTVLENLDYGNQVYWRVGLGVALTDTAGLSLDVVQHLSWTERSEASRPLEALLGGSYRLFNQNLVVRGGLGAGLNQGIGAPRFRAVLSVSWERPPKDRDSDGDGLLDSLDACVWAPEDMDGIADGDGCPEPTRITVRVVDANGEELLDGGWKAGRSSGPSGEAFDQLDGTVVIDGWGPQHFTETVEIGVSGEVQLVTITLTPIPGVLAVIGRDPAGVLIEGITWGVQNTAHGDLVAGDPVEMLPGAYELYVDAPGYRREWVEVLVTVDTDDIVEVTLTSSMAQVRVDRIAITE